MIAGKVNSDLEAIIRISVEDNQVNYHIYDCVVDTGFDGFIALPADTIQELRLVPRGNRRIILINDTEASSRSTWGRCGRGSCWKFPFSKLNGNFWLERPS